MLEEDKKTIIKLLNQISDKEYIGFILKLLEDFCGTK